MVVGWMMLRPSPALLPPCWMSLIITTTRRSRNQVVVRVRPVLLHEDFSNVAVTCTPDGSRVQVRWGRRTPCCLMHVFRPLPLSTLIITTLPTSPPLTAAPPQILLPEKDCCKPATPAAATLASSPSVPPREGRPDARAYEFGACLPGAATQADLFETCGVEELVEAAVDG
jgi:hypothetical protein